MHAGHVDYGFLEHDVVLEGYAQYETFRAMIEEVQPCVLEDVEEDLPLLKDMASKVVENLAKNNSLLDPEEDGIGWLTCTKVQTRETPWRSEGV